MIQHTAAPILARYLIAEGVGTTPNSGGSWPIFYNSMPEMPNNAITVYDTAGTLDGREQRTGKTITHPGWQLRVRVVSTGYDLAIQKLFVAQQKLDSILRSVVVVSGKSYRIQAIRRTSDIIPIGQEEGGTRLLFTLNGTISYGENV